MTKSWSTRLRDSITRLTCRHHVTYITAIPCPTEGLHIHRIETCATCHYRVSEDVIAITRYPDILDLPPHPLAYDENHRYH